MKCRNEEILGEFRVIEMPQRDFDGEGRIEGLTSHRATRGR